MKITKRSLVIMVVIIFFGGATAFGVYVFGTRPLQACAVKPAAQQDSTQAKKSCVFQTVFGIEPSDSNFIYKTPEKEQKSIAAALVWMAKAQGNDGGWGGRQLLPPGYNRSACGKKRPCHHCHCINGAAAL